MQNSHPVRHLSMPSYFKNIAWNGWRGGFTTQSYIQDSVFYRTRQRLKFSCLHKNIHTRCLTGFLKHPTVILPTLTLHHIICTNYLA